MIALEWQPAVASADLALAATGAVADDAGLATAVLLSLFLDRRARADDPLPDAAGDRRGWVGDALAPEATDRIGSRLWLLARERQSEGTRVRAEIYAREALDWLLRDGLAEAVAVDAQWSGPGVLGLRVRVAPGAFDTLYNVAL